jgi:hypothetical protein
MVYFLLPGVGQQNQGAHGHFFYHGCALLTEAAQIECGYIVPGSAADGQIGNQLASHRRDRQANGYCLVVSLS